MESQQMYDAEGKRARRYDSKENIRAEKTFITKGYCKVLGVKCWGIYSVLCIHAYNHKTAKPISLLEIADEIGIARSTVWRKTRLMEVFSIIRMLSPEQKQGRGHKPDWIIYDSESWQPVEIVSECLQKYSEKTLLQFLKVFRENTFTGEKYSEKTLLDLLKVFTVNTFSAKSIHRKTKSIQKKHFYPPNPPDNNENQHPNSFIPEISIPSSSFYSTENAVPNSEKKEENENTHSKKSNGGNGVDASRRFKEIVAQTMHNMETRHEKTPEELDARRQYLLKQLNL